MLVCVFLTNFARETAGAARIRHSPRPLIGARLFKQTSGASRRGMFLHVYHPSSPRKRGPITTGVGGCAKAIQQRLSQQATRRMDPGSALALLTWPGRRM